MRKIVKMRIIGFEIAYRDLSGEFEMNPVYEGEDLPKKSCISIYVPLKRNAWQVHWEYDSGDLDYLGVEFEPCGTCRVCKEYEEDD